MSDKEYFNPRELASTGLLSSSGAAGLSLSAALMSVLLNRKANDEVNKIKAPLSYSVNDVFNNNPSLKGTKVEYAFGIPSARWCNITGGEVKIPLHEHPAKGRFTNIKGLHEFGHIDDLQKNLDKYIKDRDLLNKKNGIKGSYLGAALSALSPTSIDNPLTTAALPSVLSSLILYKQYKNAVLIPEIRASDNAVRYANQLGRSAKDLANDKKALKAALKTYKTPLYRGLAITSLVPVIAAYSRQLSNKGNVDIDKWVKDLIK